MSAVSSEGRRCTGVRRPQCVQITERIVTLGGLDARAARRLYGRVAWPIQRRDVEEDAGGCAAMVSLRRADSWAPRGSNCGYGETTCDRLDPDCSPLPSRRRSAPVAAARRRSRPQPSRRSNEASSRPWTSFKPQAAGAMGTRSARASLRAGSRDPSRPRAGRAVRRRWSRSSSRLRPSSRSGGTSGSAESARRQRSWTRTGRSQLSVSSNRAEHGESTRSSRGRSSRRERSVSPRRRHHPTQGAPTPRGQYLRLRVSHVDGKNPPPSARLGSVARP